MCKQLSSTMALEHLVEGQKVEYKKADQTKVKQELQKVWKFPIEIQLISYIRYLECTLIQWRLSIYPYCTQVAEGTFFMKSPVFGEKKKNSR